VEPLDPSVREADRPTLLFGLEKAGVPEFA
jgi:hypothetical protein